MSDSSDGVSFPETVGVQEVSGADNNMSIFVCLEKEHDLAKAVKSDDAEVPAHLWDSAVCGEAPTEAQVKALATLREFSLRVYRRRLSREIREYMVVKFGAMARKFVIREQSGVLSLGDDVSR